MEPPSSQKEWAIVSIFPLRGFARGSSSLGGLRFRQKAFSTRGAVKSAGAAVNTTEHGSIRAFYSRKTRAKVGDFEIAEKSLEKSPDRETSAFRAAKVLVCAPE